VRHHLLVGELVAVGRLDDAVQQQHGAVRLRLKHADVLLLGEGVLGGAGLERGLLGFLKPVGGVEIRSNTSNYKAAAAAAWVPVVWLQKYALQSHPMPALAACMHARGWTEH